MAHIECICPPKADGETRHPEGDEVTLRPTLDFRSARACVYAVQLAASDGADGGEYLAVLSEQYLYHGISAWTVHDDRGKAVEPSRDAIETYLLSNVMAAATVADEADVLYSEIILPLVLRASGSSQPSPTSGSTSATNGAPSPTRNGSSKTRRQKPSKRSSTTTLPMDDTEMTLPVLVGVSSFSQS